MSRLAFLSVITILVINASCTKNNCREDCSEQSLINNWTFVRSYMDIGNGTGSWHPAPPDQFMQFNADGSFSSNVMPFEHYNRYQVLNDSTIRFFETPAHFNDLQYGLDCEGLMMNPLCFEKCEFRFERR